MEWNPMSQKFETPTLTLTDFLLARFARDADAAQTVLRARQLCTCTHHNLDEHFDHCAVWKQFVTLPRVGDPARVLAECEAKRQIVEMWQLVHGRDDGAFAIILGQDRSDAQVEDALTHVLRLLAHPYADHADYRPEWRVERPGT
jgi:hypothetical protein